MKNRCSKPQGRRQNEDLRDLSLKETHLSLKSGSMTSVQFSTMTAHQLLSCHVSAGQA